MKEKILKLLAKNDEIRELAKKEERDLTPDEVKSLNDNLDEIERLEAAIKAEERAQETEKRLSQPANEPDFKPDPEADEEQHVQMGKDRKATRPFRTLGEQLQAVARAANPSIGVVDPRLYEVRATGLSEGIPSDAGFLVQTDFSAELFKKVHETGLLAPKCRQVPISATANGLKMNAIDETSRADGSRWGGIRAYWKEEAASKTASKPKFRQMELSLKKLIGLCYATDELLADTVALESVITQGFGEEFGFKVDDAVINGTGAGQPLGILNAACLVSISKETNQAAATFRAENAMKMFARLWPRSIPNSLWLINQELWPQIFQLHLAVGTGGAPMYIEPGKIADAPYGALLGRPILPIEQCQALGTKGDVFLADFSQYILIDKGGIESESSIHVQFIYDESVFRFVYRVDGQPLWNSALTPYKGTSSTLSPFVTLNARS